MTESLSFVSQLLGLMRQLALRAAENFQQIKPLGTVHAVVIVLMLYLSKFLGEFVQKFQEMVSFTVAFRSVLVITGVCTVGTYVTS